MPPDCSQGGHLGQASLRDCVTTGSRRDAGRGRCPAHCPDVSWGQRRNDGECGTTTLQASTTCILAVNLWSHFFGGHFFATVDVSKKWVKGSLGLGGNLHRPLKSTGSSLEFHEAKAFHPLAELMELRRQWRVPLAGDFHERWWRSTRRGWWLLTR